MISSSLVIAELVLRFSGRVAVDGLHTVSEEHVDKIPGMFEPGQEFIYRKNPNLPFQVSINSLGYRGPEIDRVKSDGMTRILCLGDSTTFGEFVDEKETFPYKLQKLFEQKNKKVEVINGGVGGTTIVDQLYFLKKSMEIAPDLVVLAFFQNDIDNLARTRPLYVTFEKNRKLKSSSYTGVIYRLFADTALFQLTLKTWAGYKHFFYQREKPEKKMNSKEQAKKRESILRAAYAEIFGDFVHYLRWNSVRLIMVILPSHHQVAQRTELSDLHDRRTQWIEDLARRKGISTVNLLDKFREMNLGKKELYLLPYDGHHSVLAYDIAANTILGSIQRNSTFAVAN